MGKRGGKWGKRGGGRPSQRVDYPDIVKTNSLYQKYYDQLGAIDEKELPEFWEALRRDLPNSFRFTGSRGHAIPVREFLKNRYIPEITAINYEGRPVEPPSPLPWYPDQLAWQMTTPKNVVRRFPPFASFQKFLVSETGVGNISRQEAVSMIPPLLLDIKPGMTVLDLCAAPGSKSAQLIEMVHSGEEARIRTKLREILAGERELSPEGDEIKLETSLGDDWSDDGRATGLLVANDVDYKRAHLLIHQIKRLNSPNLIVTNHDATHYPSIKLPSDPSGKGKYLKFDRILADVPCSGDGTARKNVSVWRSWTPGNAVGLNSIQVRILIRSLQMLKVGGRVVYSTCSMNPLENEAVVAAAVKQCGGMSKVDIVDSSNMLPELKRAPGLSQWKIMDKQGAIWDSWDSFCDHHGQSNNSKITRALFAPDSSEGIPLENCMRVYPHFQDTGGFFIAVLEKKSEIKVRLDGSSTVDAEKSKARAPIPPVTAALNELESKANGDNPGEHIKALDSLAPPEEPEPANPSAAARQNMEEISLEGLSPRKHKLDEDAADAIASTKRPKVRGEDVDAPVPPAEADRLVHFPPPPAATAAPELPPPPQDDKKRKQHFEEPFKYIDPDHEALRDIYAFYDLHPRFPRDRFMVRNGEGKPSKTIYYTSSLARDILRENEGKGIKFVHCGIKMFVKQDVQSEEVCRWRAQTDGLPLLEAWVGNERVIRLSSRTTFRKLLIEMFPKVGGGGWENLGEIGERARDISMGCCLLRIEKGEGDDAFSERMVLPIWRSMHSLNLMLPKEDRKAMLLRLYNDSTPLQDSSKDRFKKQNGDVAGPGGSPSPEPSALQSEIKEEEQEGTGVKDFAEGEMSADDEDGGVRLPSGDVEKEAKLTVDMKVGIKDEEDVKKELE